MGEVNDRDFSLCYAMMAAQKLMPKKGRPREMVDFRPAVAAFETQLRLSGFKIVEDERPVQSLPSCGD